MDKKEKTPPDLDSLVADTLMMDLIQELWFLPRDLVSDGFDRALFRIAEEVPMKIHEYPTGEQCWTWKIPEKWTCKSAYIETLDGTYRPGAPHPANRLIDYDNHPLHVISYSLPFDGTITRQELLDHLHTHPRNKDAIPYVFKFYDRDWGFCTSKTLQEQLVDDFYRVLIDSTFEPGTLKVGEILVPGESDETVIIVSHLCHPGMVNDDLSGVVVGLDVARSLLRGQRPFYTYRFLILPETIGSVAYLSHNEELIPSMKAGLFLEMLGNDSPHALQRSFQSESQADRCMLSAFRDLDPHGYSAPYRSVINNDERQFNAPGVRVPMLSISRVEPEDSPTRPYAEYHSSLDTPEIVNQQRLEMSRNLVLGLIDAWERNQYVVNLFKGEIFCSGYGIWIDYRQNPDGHHRLFEIMERCDGSYTVADIAMELGTGFQAVWEVVELLRTKGLVEYSRTPQPESH